MADWIRFADQTTQVQRTANPPTKSDLSWSNTLECLPVTWRGRRCLAIRGSDIPGENPELYRRLFLPQIDRYYSFLEATDILYLQAASWTPMAIKPRGVARAITLQSLVGMHGLIRHSRNPKLRTCCAYTWQQSLGLTDGEAYTVAESSADVELRDLKATRRQAQHASEERARTAVAHYYLARVFLTV